MWREEAGRDLGFALRTLRKNPGFTLVAVLSLALGIGANTALFTVAQAVLLKSLPVNDPSALVFVTHQGKSGPPDKPAPVTNFPLYEFLRDGNRSFASVLAFSPTHLRLRRAADTEGVSAQWVTPNYFSSLGVKAFVGRTWAPEDEAHPALVVISHRLWSHSFAADPGVVGKTLLLSGQPVTIIGVTPPDFLGLSPGTPVDLTLLLAAQPQLQPERGNLSTLGRGSNDEPVPTWELFIMGRRQPGVTTPQAEAETTVLLRQWAASRHASDAYMESSFYRVELTPGGRGLDTLRQRFTAPLGLLAAIVGGVLLIACANLTNLLLARTVSRRHELSVRKALGASRGRLIRQLLTESLTLTTLGGIAGLIFGSWGSSFLAALLASGKTPVEIDAQPDLRVLGFTLALSLFAGVAVGLVPALRASAIALNEGGARTSRRTGRWGLSQSLVAVQLATSLCLLVATGLFAANLRRILAIDPGFHSDNLLSVSFDWAGAGYTRPQMMAFAGRAVEQARTVPGVQSASATHIEPLGEQKSQRWFSTRGATPGEVHTGVVDLNVVSGDYFKTIHLPLVRGREFDAGDRADSTRVAIISESLARACFGDADPVGQFAWIARDTTGAPLVIVGVARDSRPRDVRDAPLQLLFLPAAQSTAWEMNLLVRTASQSPALIADLRRALAALGPDVAVRDVTTPQALRARSLLQERLFATLSSFFGPLALLLTAVGLYGLLAYDVAQRTREIGVHLALGARPRDMLRLVLKRGLLLVAVGIVAGLLASTALAGLLRRFLFAIPPGDPSTLLLAVGVLLLVALLACWLPARRAARVDPIVALRCE
jgi:predicted permease